MSTWHRLAGGALLGGAVASFVPALLWVRHDGWRAGVPVVLMGVLAASALLVLRLPAHRRDGWWLAAAVVGMGMASLDAPELEAGYWHQVAFVGEYSAAACLVTPFLRYPGQAPPERTVVGLSVASWLALVGVRLVASLLWDPAMDGYAGPAHWLTIHPWEGPSRGIPWLIPVAFVVVASWFTVVQWRRQRSAGGPARAVIRLLALLTTAMAWGLFARTVLDLTEATELSTIGGLVHMTFTAAGLLVVLAVALGLTLRRAAFIEDLVAAAGQPSAIEHVLRRYAGDPTLRLLFLTDDGWTDAGGRPADTDGEAARATRTLVAEEGAPVVKAEVAGNLDLADRATQALLDGAGFVLHSARLSVQQAVQAHELQQSRQRIVEASVAQRRQIERDLHDGAQQHLLAAQAALSRAELLHEPADVSGAIRDARVRLASTLDELRRLARGVHPALLSQAGLGAALGSLTGLSERVLVTVDPALDGRRFAPVIEATAWFVASEGLVNALKHHDAPVEVHAGMEADGTLVCTVTDDGPGGATLTEGGGLAGLRDRVHATAGASRSPACQDTAPPSPSD